MLVLSRQRDETIMIGDDIELTVVDIRGDKVRLGIKAPAQVAVHRKEIYESIRRENEQAAVITSSEIISLGPQLSSRVVRTNGTLNGAAKLINPNGTERRREIA